LVLFLSKLPLTRVNSPRYLKGIAPSTAAPSSRLAEAPGLALRLSWDWLERAQGFGSDRPLVPDDGPGNRKKNRRIELALIPDLSALGKAAGATPAS